MDQDDQSARSSQRDAKPGVGRFDHLQVEFHRSRPSLLGTIIG
jgi:hypothetical protein